MSSQELGFGAIACLGLLIAAIVLWANRRRSRLAFGAAALCLVGLLGAIVSLLWLTYGQSHPLSAQDILPPATDQGFTGSDSCRSCHPRQYSSWRDSYHRTMTQPATPQAVVAPFAKIRLTTGNTHALLFRRGDEFWADIVDPEWELRKLAGGEDASLVEDPPRRRVQLVMTTGSHNFQAYWYQSGFGRELWQFPWRYHIGRQQWLHRRDVFLTGEAWRPAAQFQVWNRNCILCHSTGGQPGQDVGANVMNKTRVAELGIACEACHGPGEEHVALMQSVEGGSEPERLAIVNPARLSAQRSSEVCGRCHSHFHHTDSEVFTTGTNFRPGDRLRDFGRLLTIDDEEPGLWRYWADGTNGSGGREYSGMSASSCFQEGDLSCLSCHSMHSGDPDDQLATEMDGNAACYQCHSEYRDKLVDHTHHPADSEASRCYNCHMPYTSLALLRAIRNHRLDSPRVESTHPASRPNACNLCHLDQTLDWTAEHLSQWYGQPRPELSDDERSVAAALDWLLRGGAAQRAVAAWHFGWKPAQEASGTDWMPPFLAKSLEDDPYSGVRWIAANSLRSLPGYVDVPLPNDAERPDGARADEIREARHVLQKWLHSPATGHSRATGDPPTVGSGVNERVESGDTRVLERLLLKSPRQIDAGRVERLQAERPDETFMIVE